MPYSWLSGRCLENVPWLCPLCVVQNGQGILWVHFMVRVVMKLKKRMKDLFSRFSYMKWGSVPVFVRRVPKGMPGGKIIFPHSTNHWVYVLSSYYLASSEAKKHWCKRVRRFHKVIVAHVWFSYLLSEHELVYVPRTDCGRGQNAGVSGGHDSSRHSTEANERDHRRTEILKDHG